MRFELLAPAANKRLAYLLLTQCGVKYPSTILPRRLMPQMLRMATGQAGYPMVFLILVQA